MAYIYFFLIILKQKKRKTSKYAFQPAIGLCGTCLLVEIHNNTSQLNREHFEFSQSVHEKVSIKKRQNYLPQQLDIVVWKTWFANEKLLFSLPMCHLASLPMKS